MRAPDVAHQRRDVRQRQELGRLATERSMGVPSVRLSLRHRLVRDGPGPLIERFGIMVEPDHPDDLGRSGFKGWYALREHDTPILDATGATPLEAVCRLILALAEAGKLSA